jgi:peptide subunit release factor 1 (eRF1)
MKIFNIEEVHKNRDESLITCPKCGCENTNICRADVVDGNDKYNAKEQFRSDVAVVKMYCENEHYFVIGIGEHKGECSIFSE